MPVAQVPGLVMSYTSALKLYLLWASLLPVLSDPAGHLQAAMGLAGSFVGLQGQPLLVESGWQL